GGTRSCSVSSRPAGCARVTWSPPVSGWTPPGPRWPRWGTPRPPASPSRSPDGSPRPVRSPAVRRSTEPAEVIGRGAALTPSDPGWIGGYRLVRRLGAGGMGLVYLGEAGDGSLVAVKVIRPEYADDAVYRRRF